MKTFVIFLNKTEKEADLNGIKAHVRHLASLDDKGLLVLAGPYEDASGGLVIIKAHHEEEAIQIALSDPFVQMGYRSFELKTLEVANRSNHYLL